MNSEKGQAWFEMRDVRRRRFSDAVWIPLRAAIRESQGQEGFVGFSSTFFGAGSVAIPIGKRREAEDLDWSSIGLIHHQGPYAFPDGYKPSDIYQRHDQVDLGVELVLQQSLDGAVPDVWHLHQDFVIALTRDTGGISALYGHDVHFGVNSKCLINTYAYDVARLPEWQQRIWMGANISPDGAVCRELLSSQMEATPVDTKSPEASLLEGIEALDQAIAERWQKGAFRTHKETEDIYKRIHRFRATDQSGLLSLAKDISRVVIDSLDVDVLRSIAVPKKDEKLGSLKLLERVVGLVSSPELAHKSLSPLFGLYELRLGDAHLPSRRLEGAFELLGIEAMSNTIQRGQATIDICARTLHTLAVLIREPGNRTPI
jgi:hypothetical protein